MFLFNAKTALHNSFKNHFLGGDSAFAFFFTGPVPDSIDTMPINKHFTDISNDCVLFQQLSATSVTAQAANQAATSFHTDNMYGAVRKHSYIERWDKWRLIPKSIHMQIYHNLDLSVVNEASHNNSDTQFRELHFAYRYMNMIRGDARDHRQYASNARGGVPYNSRSAQNAPMIYQYDQEVTVDSFELFQWDSANNTSAYVSVDTWDTSLNEGQGDWVRRDTNIQMYDNIYSRQVIKLGGSYTSTKFRFTFSDTGGGSWALNYMWLLGDEPTWGKETVDITWALVCGKYDSYSSYIDINQFDCFNDPLPYLPLMLVDVGEEGSGATIELSQATGLDGNSEPNIQKFDIEFLDKVL